MTDEQKIKGLLKMALAIGPEALEAVEALKRLSFQRGAKFATETLHDCAMALVDIAGDPELSWKFIDQD